MPDELYVILRGEDRLSPVLRQAQRTAEQTGQQMGGAWQGAGTRGERAAQQLAAVQAREATRTAALIEREAARTAAAAERSAIRLAEAHERAYLRAATAAEHGGRRMDAALAGFAGGLAGGAVVMGLHALGQAAEQAFGAVAGAAVGLNAKLEQSRIAFTTMLGSSQRADAFLKDLADFAAKTPFEFPELTRASQRMLAMGFTAEQVRPLLTSVGNAAAALGAGAQGIDRATLALGQMQARGKATSEEFMQLTELGIPMWDFLARKLNTDVAGAMAAVEKRTVSAATAIEAFQEGTASKFGDMMSQQAKTFDGAMSTIKDSLGMAVAQGAEPFFALVRDGAVQLADTLQSADFQAFTANARTAMAGAAETIRDVHRDVQLLRQAAATPINLVVGVQLPGAGGQKLGEALRPGLEASGRELGGRFATAFVDALSSVTGTRPLLGFARAIHEGAEQAEQAAAAKAAIVADRQMSEYEGQLLRRRPAMKAVATEVAQAIPEGFHAAALDLDALHATVTAGLVDMRDAIRKSVTAEDAAAWLDYEATIRTVDNAIRQLTDRTIAAEIQAMKNRGEVMEAAALAEAHYAAQLESQQQAKDAATAATKARTDAEREAAKARADMEREAERQAKALAETQAVLNAALAAGLVSEETYTGLLAERQAALERGTTAAEQHRQALQLMSRSTDEAAVATAQWHQELGSFVSSTLSKLPWDIRAAVTAQQNLTNSYDAAVLIANHYGVSLATVHGHLDGVKTATDEFRMAQQRANEALENGGRALTEGERRFRAFAQAAAQSREDEEWRKAWKETEAARIGTTQASGEKAGKALGQGMAQGIQASTAPVVAVATQMGAAVGAAAGMAAARAAASAGGPASIGTSGLNSAGFTAGAWDDLIRRFDQWNNTRGNLGAVPGGASFVPGVTGPPAPFTAPPPGAAVAGAPQVTPGIGAAGARSGFYEAPGGARTVQGGAALAGSLQQQIALINGYIAQLEAAADVGAITQDRANRQISGYQGDLERLQQRLRWAQAEAAAFGSASAQAFGVAARGAQTVVQSAQAMGHAVNAATAQAQRGWASMLQAGGWNVGGFQVGGTGSSPASGVTSMHGIPIFSPITPGTLLGLADGGIVRRPTVAMLGERGPEAVVPLPSAGGLGTTVNVALTYAPTVGVASDAELSDIVKKLGPALKSYLRGKV